MRSAILAFTVAIVSLIVSAEDSPIDRFAVQGGTIQLHCDIPTSDDPDVQWVDKVYGSEQNPEKIFHSRNNPHFHVLETHENGRNYRVDHEFTLTISNLSMEMDVGQYTCRSRIGDRIHRKKYYLTIGALPECSGKTVLRSGEETSLSCEMEFSGRNLKLEWLEDGKTVDSIDQYEIRLAKKVVDVHATHLHDGRVFQCRMSLGSSVQAECSLTLNVSYGVHEPKFHPVKESFEPGDEIKCTAKGNPLPSVSLGPDFPGSKEGSGWAALIVEESWIGQQIQVQCTASNSVSGVEHTKSQEFSFYVSAPKHHNHHHHHQLQQQHSTEPTVHTQEDESKHIAPGDHQMEEKKPIAVHEQEPHSQPKPNVKPVRSDSSTGSLLRFSTMVAILSLVTATLV